MTIHHVIDGGQDFYSWLVIELVPGSSLAELLDEGTLLTPQEAARILRPDGDAVLTDFGTATLQRTGSVDSAVSSLPLTATGELIGTLDYLFRTALPRTARRSPSSSPGLSALQIAVLPGGCRLRLHPGARHAMLAVWLKP
ncbi:hypothetical protein [Streptomyces coffeae]|uniref:Uncharacterized protein n=1 Tax=Streptomyces coffeae TaxID=621382 RepID=A0ABS1NN79_9ACTN|nr:hypothetical protein [Streptomyces coffeae]MBL1101521.1 hypothetical protein [Streptomyces coffeae]